jgi:hypothetical protein
MNHPLLTIELVPETCWFSNLRSELTPEQWRHVRYVCYRNANYRCEICGGTGPKWPVECHEIWHYNDRAHVQTLKGLISLCPACHEVKHIGLAGHRGHQQRALKHLAKVNGWTAKEAKDYLYRCMRKWTGRSEYEWALDCSWLTKEFGIRLTPHT